MEGLTEIQRAFVAGMDAAIALVENEVRRYCSAVTPDSLEKIRDDVAAWALKELRVRLYCERQAQIGAFRDENECE